MKAPLFIEIGCEEIPARMIARAARDLGDRVVGILDQAGIEHREAWSWGGSRRLTVHVNDVDQAQEDRVEDVLGPPASAAFDADDNPTPAATGFARKQGVEVSELAIVETPKGRYVGFRREVQGRELGQILAESLSRVVESMTFPKTMRWGDGRYRWVRPVHWVLALHGKFAIDLELFGVRSRPVSEGHRFLAPGPVEVDHPEAYVGALRDRFVVADPDERREILQQKLSTAAQSLQGEVVDDRGLLEEVVDLVEWPGVIVGHFDRAYLELPREILVTTLRHHQKCFSVQVDGDLLPNFLAVANTDRDDGGHVRRGNEWVVSGRLEDARFFWKEDNRTPLVECFHRLNSIVFHDKAGTFADKADRLERLAESLARSVGASEADMRAASGAAKLAKIDLSTALVGEFPELQGVIGGLLLREADSDSGVSEAVYGQYRPEGPADPLPETVAGCVLALVDKLDNVAELIKVGERPTGSRDPFGLRRAANGIFRIAIERRWPVTLDSLAEITGGSRDVRSFLHDRLLGYLRDGGYSSNEIQAVIRPKIDRDEVYRWGLPDIVARLDAIRGVRDRDDFRLLVKLTERANNIVIKNEDLVRGLRDATNSADAYHETESAAVALRGLVDEIAPVMASRSNDDDYGEIVELLSRFIAPVETFFDDVLVIDKNSPEATCNRYGLVSDLRQLLTRFFDIRELAGQADRKG